MIKNNNKHNVTNRCYSAIKKKNKKEHANDVRIKTNIPITGRDNMYVILSELYDILLSAHPDVDTVVEDYKVEKAYVYDHATNPIRWAKNRERAKKKSQCSNKKVDIFIETKSNLRKLDIHNKATFDLIINYSNLNIYK